jgi:Domain of unknown function (DUF4062)/NACHT domain
MKIFLSSTILDLKDLRDTLFQGLVADGHQVFASERGTLPIEPGKHSYEQCLKAAAECDCLVAAIDGRFGGDYPQKGSNQSITEVEIETAISQGKKTLVFVRQSVWDALATQKAAIVSGKANDHWTVKNIIEDIKVFGLIDRIRRKSQDNWIFQFNYPTDLLAQIRVQIGSLGSAIDWLDRSRQLLEAQKHLTTNRLLKESNRKIDDINIGLVERKERPKMKEVEDAAQGSQIYHPVEYIDTKRYEHEAFLAEVVGKPAWGKHIAIIGEPGAGKTTILTKIGTWLILQAEKQPEQPLVIAWISLASLAKQEELSEYFYTSWLKSAHPAARPPKNWEDELVKLVEQKRVWLLLDGLDEISKSDSLIWLNGQLAGWGQNLQVVVTCRLNQWEAAAGGNALTNSFDVYRTLDYSYQTSQGDDQVKEFICKWFADNEKVATQIRTELDAPGKERIKDLVKNPLRLTLLCASWEKDNQALPETQADLYQRFVDYLYGWKANLKKFKKAVKLREELDLALGILAKAGLNRGSNHDGVARRFRFTAREISQLWKDHNLPDTLLPAAENLGWLNVVEADPINPMYAFYHTTFQEYFAACSIPDWDYFLPRAHRAHIDRPELCKGEDVPTYRVFEQEWQQVILFWIGRRAKDISDEIKEEFIKILTDFQGYEGGFYYYRAYIMAAILVGEFKSSKQAESIVKQIVEFAFGRFNSEENKWESYLESIESLARAIIPFNHRQYAIESLKNRLLQSNSSDYTRSHVESALYQITMPNEKIVEDDSWRSGDLDFHENHFYSELEKQKFEEQRIEKAITILNRNDYNNCFGHIEILGQIAVGHEGAIKALTTFIAQYNRQDSIGTLPCGSHAAVTLGKIAIGNKSAIKDLIDILQNDNVNRNMCFNVHIAISKIVTRSEMPLVIENVKEYLTEESCKLNSHRFNKCYTIIFQYAQSLPYPEFYKAWHQREEPASLNLEFSNDD